MSVKRTLGMLRNGAGYGTGLVFLTAGLLIAGLALMPAVSHLNNADHFAAAVRNGAARGVLGLGFATLGFCIMAGTSSTIADDDDGWGTHTDEPGLASCTFCRTEFLAEFRPCPLCGGGFIEQESKLVRLSRARTA